MGRMLEKIRNKILAVFLLFSLISMIIIFLGYNYIRQRDKLHNIIHEVNKVHADILQDMNIINNFFTYDTKNPDFFITKNSFYLKLHNGLFTELKKDLQHLIQDNITGQLLIRDELKSIQSKLTDHENKYKRMIDLLLERGYKDWGTIGKMRDYIHRIEDMDEINIGDVLMLRRHEKDYIIRNELQYLEKHKSLSTSLRKKIIHNPAINKTTKDTALNYMNKYLMYFQQMVDLDKKIGIKDNSALKQDMNHLNLTLMEELNLLKNKTLVQAAIILEKLKSYFIIYLIIIAVTGILISLFFSKTITLDLSALTDDISKFVKSNFKDQTSGNLKTTTSNDEVNQLISNYIIMKKEIISLINNFNEKVEEKSHEVIIQKNQIEQQKKEISTKHDQLLKQKQLIEKQKSDVEHNNNELISSFNYAKIIQEALLPQREIFENLFSDHFILYKPKEIISGDFYWAKRCNTNGDDIAFVAIADCTGHGVPGALMSMLGVASLNEIVLRKKSQDTSEILNQLRTNIMDCLQQNQYGSKSNDGMDIAFMSYNFKTKTLQFSGANRHLYLLRKGHLSIIKGDKMPIGKYALDEHPFKHKVIKIKKGDRIYLFTDGYADQFGGTYSKKFKQTKLNNLIKTHYDKPMHVQKDILEKASKDWQGHNEQIDDILVCGIALM